MPISTLRYDLVEGYIHNWLVGGPQQLPAAGLGGDDVDGARRALTDRYADQASGIIDMPVERGPLSEGAFAIGEYEGAWSYVRCAEDHYVDLSAVYSVGAYARGWAYAQLAAPADRSVTLVLTSAGPADLWVNGEHVHRLASAGRAEIAVALSAGVNEVLIRFDAFGARATLHRMALRLTDTAADTAESITVQLPTTIEPLEIGRAHV